MIVIDFPRSYKAFTGRFYDGTFTDNGDIGAIEFAVRGCSLRDKRELLVFFDTLMRDELPPRVLESIWWAGSSPHSIDPETINAFFDLIIEKLSASLEVESPPNH